MVAGLATKSMTSLLSLFRVIPLATLSVICQVVAELANNSMTSLLSRVRQIALIILFILLPGGGRAGNRQSHQVTVLR